MCARMHNSLETLVLKNQQPISVGIWEKVARSCVRTRRGVLAEGDRNTLDAHAKHDFPSQF